MAGNKVGGKKAALKILAKDPQFYKRIGAVGGASGTGHAFAHGKITAKEAGRLGGQAERLRVWVADPKPFKAGFDEPTTWDKFRKKFFS